MRTRILLMPLALLGCQAAEPSPEKTPLPDSSPGLIRITEEAHGLVSKPGSTLVAELKGDTAEARRMIDDLWQRHHLSFPKKERIHYGPDSGFTQIEFVHGSERIVVGSWHTVERTSPKLFAGHTGLSALEGRSQKEALAAEPESYRRFRSSFDAIYDTVVGFKKR